MDMRLKKKHRSQGVTMILNETGTSQVLADAQFVFGDDNLFHCKNLTI